MTSMMTSRMGQVQGGVGVGLRWWGTWVLPMHLSKGEQAL